MKAWVLHGINDLKFETVSNPTLSNNEVLVAVKAAGICGSDIPRIFETGAHNMPLIPGHEFSGVVEEIGQNVGGEWLHRPVGVFPLIPCGKCLPCQHGQYEMCRSYDYLGSRSNGGFAEYVSVPVKNLIALPEGVSFEEAAMLEPMAVAVHAMRKGTADFALEKEAVVAVCGLGTIGLLLTMFLLDAGYRNIYVIGNKDFQREKAISLGIPLDCYCDSREKDASDWLQECAGGADLFFECVGRHETLSCGVNSAAPSASVVLVGNPHSDMALPRDVYWKILRNQLNVFGTWNSSFTGEDTDDWHYVMRKLKTHSVSPTELISHRLTPEKLMMGLSVMRDKKEDYCKIEVVSGKEEEIGNEEGSVL